MNPLDIQDFFSIGTIIKPHGLKGSMIIEVEEGFEDVLTESDYLLVEIEGGLVPFFISDEGINFRTSTTLCLAFDEIDTAEKLRPYCGCKIYLRKEGTIEQDSNEEFSELMGVTVLDKMRGKLGKIIRVDNFSGNVVLTIEYGPHEILIPFSERLIIQFDEVKQELHLDCPEGLIDLYLE